MTMTTLKEKKRTINILLVEDNYGDALLLRKAFEKSSTPVNIVVAEDGEQALAALAKEGDFAKTAMPDLILLDINLPRLNGKEVLARIKSEKKYQHIPVIMLTSSSAELDVAKSYHLHANAYIVKPVDLSKIANIITAIELFWFELVVLPDPGDVKIPA